ncbi:MAG TPA: suppressor of fused domain protein [Actinospica sp.]|nr:suppressor of fused domain protein [Actinospica sp.]
MTIVATAAGVFSGFLPQITGRLGPVRRFEAAAGQGVDRGFAVFHLGAPGGEVGTAVTDGLRFQRLNTLYPLELCCTLLTEDEETAHRIVLRVGRMMIDGRATAGVGTLIVGDRPLHPDHAMVGVVCAGHPFTDADFDLVRDRDGRVRVQILTLIPATEAELALAADQGVEVLFEHWHGLAADLADLARPSAV